jgi:hypothetical protein
MNTPFHPDSVRDFPPVEKEPFPFGGNKKGSKKEQNAKRKDLFSFTQS